MTLLALTAMLIGTMLGFRFKIPILAPAIFFCLLSALSFSTAHTGLWSVLIALVLATTALQVGYLGGSVVGLMLAGARARKISHTSDAIAQKSR